MITLYYLDHCSEGIENDTPARRELHSKLVPSMTWEEARPIWDEILNIPLFRPDALVAIEVERIDAPCIEKAIRESVTALGLAYWRDYESDPNYWDLYVYTEPEQRRRVAWVTAQRVWSDALNDYLPWGSKFETFLWRKEPPTKQEIAAGHAQWLHCSDRGGVDAMLNYRFWVTPEGRIAGKYGPDLTHDALKLDKVFADPDSSWSCWQPESDRPHSLMVPVYPTWVGPGGEESLTPHPDDPEWVVRGFE